MKVIAVLMFLFFAVSALGAEDIFKDAGTAGLVFLKIGVGARASGLAGAYSAVADKSTAVFWNPAGLANLKGMDASFAHDQYVEGMKYETVSAGLQTDVGNFGLGAGALYADDLELREKPGAPEGYYRYYDYVLSLSYARRMSPEADFGVTAKALQERIYLYTTTGFAFDFGAAFRPEGLKNFVVAGALQNLGPKFKYREVPFRLPLTIRVGGAYRVPVEVLDGHWLLSLEGWKPVDTDYVYSGGLEYIHAYGLALRAGYKFGHDTESISVGAGFAVGRLCLDYSYTPWGYDFGGQHWISLGMNL
jgi:hypothetical protein